MTGHIDPSRESLDALRHLPPGEPIQMLNLLRFSDAARYPEGHEHADKGWSGRRAYQEYARTSGPVFARLGGVIVWQGSAQDMVIGPQDERWDQAFVAQYPSGATFLEMLTDPDYRSAVVNRTAALSDSRLIRLTRGEGIVSR